MGSSFSLSPLPLFLQFSRYQISNGMVNQLTDIRASVKAAKYITSSVPFPSAASTGHWRTMKAQSTDTAPARPCPVIGRGLLKSILMETIFAMALYYHQIPPWHKGLASPPKETIWTVRICRLHLARCVSIKTILKHATWRSRK